MSTREPPALRQPNASQKKRRPPPSVRRDEYSVNSRLRSEGSRCLEGDGAGLCTVTYWRCDASAVYISQPTQFQNSHSLERRPPRPTCEVRQSTPWASRLRLPTYHHHAHLDIISFSFYRLRRRARLNERASLRDLHSYRYVTSRASTVPFLPYSIRLRSCRTHGRGLPLTSRCQYHTYGCAHNPTTPNQVYNDGQQRTVLLWWGG